MRGVTFRGERAFANRCAGRRRARPAWRHGVRARSRGTRRRALATLAGVGATPLAAASLLTAPRVAQGTAQGAALGSAALERGISDAILAAQFGAAREATPDGEGGAPMLEIAPRIEHGDSVPVRLSAPAGPEGGPRTIALVLIAPANPEPLIGRWQFGALAAEAFVATRVRVAADQTLTAAALDDAGTFRRLERAVVVAVGGCGAVGEWLPDARRGRS